MKTTKLLNRPATLSLEFLDFCDTRNPTGALIIIYWAVLLSRETYAWWLDGWLPRLIRGCEELLVSKPELVQWLAWPVEMSKRCSEDKSVNLCSTQASPTVLTPADGAMSVDTTPLTT